MFLQVETVGDCYVAVAGIPKQRSDHATALVQFAHEIMAEMKWKTHELELFLGPDTGKWPLFHQLNLNFVVTGDLQLRIGCHSGPVTAGVIRGDRSRFQVRRFLENCWYTVF